MNETYSKMIRSCEDVKTMKEFHKFGNYRLQIIHLGLLETANMIAWNQDCLISPDLLNTLY